MWYFGSGGRSALLVFVLVCVCLSLVLLVLPFCCRSQLLNFMRICGSSDAKPILLGFFSSGLGAYRYRCRDVFRVSFYVSCDGQAGRPCTPEITPGHPLGCSLPASWICLGFRIMDEELHTTGFEEYQDWYLFLVFWLWRRISKA